VTPVSINPAADGAELAWAGGNDWLRKHSPDWSMRLYKSTFPNPRPDVAISRIDYVSTMTEAAPFLVGLTLE